MKKYTVITHFRWGQLQLEKGQHVLIEDQGDDTALVTVEHQPGLTQAVTLRAVDSMVFLKKIQEY